jgi:ABC-type transport system involved in multi-copper enzyme maturation permease subunit
MNTLRSLYHLALADFYERARRSRFLLILAAVIFLGVLVNSGAMGMDLASVDSPFLVRYHGALNSAWIGTMTVMLANTFLGLFGFYLVSDCIKRDIHTGVGQIIATTPVRRGAYLVGKWISNFVVLTVMVLILAAAAVIMVLFQGETELDPGALLMPFLAVALPNMALTAALAAFFETVHWLRGAMGNVVYFFLWVFSLILWYMTQISLPFFQDPIGYNIFGTSLHASASAAFPNDSIAKSLSVGSFNEPGVQVRVFDWAGLDWSLGIVGEQWLWVAVGLGLILLSALWFARFDPSREGRRRARRKPEEAEEDLPDGTRRRLPRVALPSLSPLVSRLAQASPFLGVLFAELRLLLNGRRWWWWAITIGLNIAILKSPLSVTKEYLLPLVWLWPLAVWSEIGNREHKNNTSQMIFSSARRNAPASGCWLAAFWRRAARPRRQWPSSNGDLPGLTGAGAVIFVPTLALALGVFSSGNRVFEVVYVIWWYVGPLQKMAGMDFTAGAPQVYLLASVGLLLLAAIWRGRQVRV